MNPQRILVILPAFNEAESIINVLEELKSLNLPVDPLVVDDGSRDETCFIARRAGANVISLPFNLGIGGAVQTGLKYAYGKGYSIALQVDADGQHDVQYIKAILDPILKGQADLVLGSRFIGPDLGWQSSPIRRVGIRFFAWLISSMTGYEVTDPTSGFRAYGQKAISVFAKDYPQDFPEPESIVIAKNAGVRLQEIPVKMRERIYGQSSIRYLKTFYYMVKVTLAILLRQISAPK